MGRKLTPLNDRSRPVRELTITLDAKAWLVALRARRPRTSAIPTNFGRRDFWPATLASADRQRDTACLADLAQGTVCKILGEDEVKPHKNVILLVAII